MSTIQGYTYILLCANGTYYTGSTRKLELRLKQHQMGLGANHTRKHGPVELVYYEEHTRIDTAFYREKQIQRWSRAKKQALIEGDRNMLVKMSIAYRDKDD
ncbi:MAG: GIY-YIG nuclease family protein [Crocinitomicaceae bacterium]|nr:GIY-YIG nuclease family protein [Crocinitomicaceae bacterium]